MGEKKQKPGASFFDECESLSVYSGQKRWRSRKKKQIYTWDSFHCEIEVWTMRGKHLGALDPDSGDLIKNAVKGRKIDV